MPDRNDERLIAMTTTSAADFRPSTAARPTAALRSGLALLCVAFAATAAVAASPTITGVSDSRNGAILAISNGPPSQSGYSVSPSGHFGSNFFDECVSTGAASACLVANSHWMTHPAIPGTISGFSASGSASATVTGSGTAIANETIQIVFEVADLAPGQSTPFKFTGWIGAAAGSAAAAISVVGPGIDEFRADPGVWNMPLSLVNGQYTLSINMVAQHSAQTSTVDYSVSLQSLVPTSGCGAPVSGSCFESGGPSCNIASCCQTVCAILPWCCESSWDGGCVKKAIDLCLPDLPLCEGNSIHFGPNDSAAISNYGLSAPNSEITIEFWLRLDESAQNPEATKPIVYCQGGGDNVIRIEVVGAGTIRFTFGSKVGGGDVLAPTLGDLFGSWHHFACVASVSGQFMRVYHNGQLVAHKNSATPFQSSSAPLHIGQSLVGSMTEFRIWGVARTPEQIAESWDRTLPIQSGLFVNYRMDSFAETWPSLIDRATASGLHHATLVGVPPMIDDRPCLDTPDLNGDGVVDGADLGILLANWGGTGLGDLNGDGIVDGADLGLLLAAWSL